MPPKKKGKKSGKKGKKSGRKSAKKSASAAPSTEMLTELSKEFFLIQIRDLEERLSRYQKKCDELELGNHDYKSQYEQQTTDKKEIVSFLKKQLEQRADEIADLQDRLIGLQQAKDAEKDQFEVQLATLRTEMQEIKDQLTSENMVLGGKLASLEEFRVQKEDLMAKFAKMEEELENQQKEHKEVIYNLERKAVVDKDRLKKEMVLRLNQVAAEFRKVSNKQMAETTKRTIRENVSINAQLAKMSDKTMELIQENDELRAKEKKQKLQIDMLEHNEKELARKNSSNQKIIRMLAEKSKQQEQMLQEYEEQQTGQGAVESEVQLLRAQVNSIKDELKTTYDQKESLDTELTKVKKDRDIVMKTKDNLVSILSGAAGTLKVSLVPPADDSLYGKVDAEMQRDTIVQTLLGILNRAAEYGVGPSTRDFVPQERTRGYSSPSPDIGRHIYRKKEPTTPLTKGSTLKSKT
ncbi:cilia- and flagella-associated protein 157 isoform X2 [Nematostella vectensis]|uniref:cilia- and flagella-associated protein 157 isoform X2 n=1 Tax=Nematostella vectensis TaxID=45351 RepID=UPI00138FA4D2|nr:cilia- and flagella-associated protein 157 isoform X2 [Nematostella vectensis]